MKNVFLLISFVIFSLSAVAQKQTPYHEEAKKLTAPLVAKYKLNHDQELTMIKIQERKLNNTANIQVYRQNDEMMYYKKKKSIQQGTDFSITRMLNPDQLKIYKKERADLRLRRANQSKLLKEKGVTGFELEKALIDIE